MIIAHFYYIYLRMEGVDALGLVLDPGLDVVQLGVGVLRLLVDLLGQPLQLLQPLNLVVDHLVALLHAKGYIRYHNSSTQVSKCHF